MPWRHWRYLPRAVRETVGGVDPQLLGKGRDLHGSQLPGLSGEKGVLGLQNGLGTLAQGIAPAFQAAQQPFGLLHFLLKVGPGVLFIGFLQQPGVVVADGDPGAGSSR